MSRHAEDEHRRAAGNGCPRLAILLAMAMFVLVVDTSLMNVSISAVVHDLHTTVSGVQSAIALEALVSAAFILIGSKVGDLIGRKRAYVLGLLVYAVGALAMALAQSLTAIIIFWAIIGGLGASLLLPAMQSLIHGNFEGAAQREGLRAGRGRGRDRRRGRAAARRVHHHLPVVARRVPARGRRHRDRAVRHQARPRRAVHRISRGRRGRRDPVRPGHGRHRAGHPGVAGRRRSPSARSWRSARSRWPGWSGGWCGASAKGSRRCSTRICSQSKVFRFGISGQLLQQIALGGTMIVAADLPADGARVQRDGGGTVPRPALAQHVREWRCSPGRRRERGVRAASSAWDSRSSRPGWSS